MIFSIYKLIASIVQQIADFTLLVMAKSRPASARRDWNDSEWQEFALRQFFREEDEVEYSLEDAQKVYHL